MALPPPPNDRIFAVMADGSRKLTYGEMAVKRNRIACSLSQRLPENIIAGAVYSTNSVEWVLCSQVCTTMGLRFSPINWHLAVDEIAYIVDDCDADVVFFSKEYEQNVLNMRQKTPKVKTWVCMDGVADGALSLEDLVNASPADAVPPAHQRKGGQIGYTGGTSGKPKGAVREGGLSSTDPQMMMQMLSEWGFMRMMPTPVQLVSAPLYHAMPGAFLGIGMVLGTTFVIQSKFDALEALGAIQAYKVNGFYMPPILLKRLLQLSPGEVSKFDLSSVKTIMSSGAACPSSVKEGIVSMFGKVLHELYGASELGGVAIMDPENMLKKPLSCGKVAAGMDVILLDENKQKIETPGVAGDIYAKGMIIDRYHKLEEKTTDSRFGEYFTVGDVGYFDEDGFLYISDRKIDMIISGGANIYPAQVEEVLHKHPSIEDVAVFGVPDDMYGESVHAAVKLVPGRSVAAKEILEWCDGKIGRFQLPKEGEISFHSDDFPRSEAGKLRKKALRAHVMEAREPPRSRL